MKSNDIKNEIKFINILIINSFWIFLIYILFSVISIFSQRFLYLNHFFYNILKIEKIKFTAIKEVSYLSINNKIYINIFFFIFNK